MRKKMPWNVMPHFSNYANRSTNFVTDRVLRVLHKHVRFTEELAKGKHVFEPALQWSAVLFNRTKAKKMFH